MARSIKNFLLKQEIANKHFQFSLLAAYEGNIKISSGFVDRHQSIVFFPLFISRDKISGVIPNVIQNGSFKPLAVYGASI